MSGSLRRAHAAVAVVVMLLGGLASPTVAASPTGATSDRGQSRHHKHILLGRMIGQLNDIRAVPQTCGNERFPAAGPLHRNRKLNRAAARYATMMARNDWFEHDEPDGTDPGERMSAAGYRWSRWAENIAAGYDTVPDVLAAWLASPGHCRALMGPYQDVGFGYAYDKDSTYGGYWVQDFASRR